MGDSNDEGRSLSELPEDVLSRILSFLSTKEAVRTSVLSKTWEYIWTSIPKLHFVQGNELPMDLVNIVNRSLHLRDAFDITSFYLSCDPHFHYGDVDTMSRIEAWMSDVVRFNVKDVKLKLLGYSSLTLPFSFVNCRTLTSLSIRAAGIILQFPSPVCFSNLKTLKLSGVLFPNERSTQNLFSGCPMLEDLKLKSCDWRYVKAVSVVSPRLRYFIMIEDEKQLTTSFNGYEFVISGGGLKFFHYEGQFQFDFNILNSQLLEDVLINFYSPANGPIPVINHFLKLLSYTSNVPNLTLTNVLCLLDIPEVVIHIPMFNGLEHLELDYKSSDLSNIGLLQMLQNMPRLRSLMFLEGIKLPSHPVEDSILNPLPPCFFNPLYFIYIFIRKGDVNELMGVKVLLKNAMVLEEMMIEFGDLVNEDTKFYFRFALLNLPKGSSDCVIKLGE